MHQTDYSPLVSVIVPVYNKEDYLEECVASIQVQTYSNLEIVLVDDGSLDSSGSICDQIAKEDKRIRVIHSPNGGTSVARNLGLAASSGEWLLFVDCDDVIGVNHVFNLLVAAIGAQVPLAITGRQDVEPGQKIPDNTSIKPSSFETLTAPEAMNRAYTIGSDITPSPWGRIYSSKLKPFLKFPEGKYFEDAFVCYKVIYAAGEVVLEDANDYFYRKDLINSNTSRRGLQYMDSVDCDQEAMLFAREKGLAQFEKTMTSSYFAHLINHFGIFCVEEDKESADVAYSRIKSDRIEGLVSPYVRKRTKAALILSFLPKNVFSRIVTVVERISQRKQ